MNLSGVIATANLAGTVTSADPAITQPIAINDGNTTNFSGSGSGVGQVDGIFRNAAIAVVSGTPFTLDLTSSTALKDLFGNAITAGHVVGIKVRNTNSVATGGNITVGAGTNGVISWAVPIEPLGQFLLEGITNGGTTIPVDGTHKILQIVASAGTVNCTLTLILRSV